MTKKTTKKTVKKTTQVKRKTNKQEEVIIEEKHPKFNKFWKTRWGDVILVVIAIGILLFTHSFALNYNPNGAPQYYTDEGMPHLFDMDSYYYARKTREFVTGENKDVITHRSEDKLQTNISDRDDSKYTLLLSKIVAIIYKIVHVFNKNVSIYKVMIYAGGILSTLVAIPAYIFVRRRTNRVGAIFGAILAGLSFSYFSHWTYGCFDTDILLYSIPLTFVCAFIESLIEKDKKKRIIWIVVSSIAFILLMLTWDVFGVYYFLVVGSAIAILLASLIKVKFKFKEYIKLPEILTAVICVAIFTLLSLIINKGVDTSILKNVASVIKPSEYSNMSYPNPGQYTSELSKIPLINFSDNNTPLEASNASLINRLDGLFVVVLFLVGVVILFVKIIEYYRKDKEENRTEFIWGIILIIWAIGGLVSVKMGLRFVKIAAIPVNLVAAYTIGKINKKGSKLGPSLIVLSFAFLVTPFIGAQAIASSMSHSANDALVTAAEVVKANTKEDAVVASWWDYGYFFEYASERRAIADGGTYNGRFSYFLANALATQSELTSVNIFKMLATSGVTASYVAEEYFGTPAESVKVLREVFNTETKEKANKLLIDKYNLTEEQANRLTSYTHPEVDYEIVLVITSNMLKMKSAINYFAHYDFEKGGILQSELSADSMYLVLYETDKDTKYYKHLYRYDKTTGSLATNIFVIK